MARGVNKVMLIGNLGQDPELNYTGSGTAVCNLRLATDESYTNPDGELVERTEWHDIVAWERLAEICDEYLVKGSRIYCEGSLQTSTWEDRDGNTRYSTEIKMRNMMMLGGEEGGRGGGRGSRDGMDQQRPERTGDYDQRQQQQQPRRESAGGGASSGGAGGQDDSFEPDDELPF